MKTKKLIELLQKADPSGELECCVDNLDIFMVHPDPAYWDGRQHILKRDWTKDTYNIIGAIYNSSGTKIQIKTYGIDDALVDNPDLPVEVIDTFVHKTMQKQVDEWREEAKAIRAEVEKDKESK